MDEEIRTRLDEKRYTEAFELVLSQYKNKVFRLCYSMLGNQALAEETAQDVFIRVWRALPGYAGRASVSTWVFAITRNTCLTALKSNSNRQSLSLDVPEVRAAAESRNASQRMDRRGPDVLHLVSELPEKYRQVITLFYMEERSYEEVARLLDLPMGTVKTYLHRARKELAAAVAQDTMVGGGR